MLTRQFGGNRAKKGTLTGRQPASRTVEPLEPRMLLSSVVVSTTADGSTAGLISLRDAIAIANTSKTPTTITFDPIVFATAQVITVAAKALDLTGAEQITIEGPPAGVTIDANRLSDGIGIAAGATARLSDITIVHAVATGLGGGLTNGGTASLMHCSFSSNDATSGTAVIDNTGHLDLIDCTIAGNSGSGIDSDGWINVAGCTITDAAGNGLDNHGTATVVDSSITHNSGVGVGNSSKISMMDVQITANGNNGTFNSASSVITASIISNNAGVGVDNSNSQTVTGCIISNNAKGGFVSGADQWMCSAVVSNCIISGNTANEGGGVYNFSNGEVSGSSLQMTDCTISNNVATGGGGGIFNSSGIALTNCTISGNSVTGGGYGGGINNDGAGLTLQNCTLAGNSSNSNGGAIFDSVGYWGGAATISSCTISGNTSSAGGAVFSDAPVTMGNTIVAGNSGSGAPDVMGGFASDGYNLLGVLTPAATGFLSSDVSGTSGTPLDAELDSLSHNGGLTETMLPHSGSPALGAGSISLISSSGIATDQRGSPRTANGLVDIGAVEGDTQVPAAPALLAFLLPPGDQVYGTLSPVVVAAEDSAGSILFEDTSQVSLNLSGAPAETSLGGNTSGTLVNGVASFGDLAVAAPGDYAMTATDAGHAPVTSATFQLVSPSANQLVFLLGPKDGNVSSRLSSVIVEVKNSFGNVVTGDSSTVTISLGANPGGAELTGQTSATVKNGAATFTDLAISAPGQGYTLVANDIGATPATSDQFRLDSTSPTGPPGSNASSLVPTLDRVSLARSVVAGAKLSANLSVMVTNQGSAFRGPVTVHVYADTAMSLDGNQVLIASSTKPLSLKKGAGKAFSFSIKSLPRSLSDGTYHLLAEASDPSGNTSLATTTQTVQVAAAFVEPAIAVGAVSPTSIPVGKSAMVLVTVTNEGNLAASGIDIALSPSEDGTTPMDLVLDSLRTGTKLLPGKNKIFKLRFKITGALSAGSYAPYVTVQLSDRSATAVGTSRFAVS